jgi:hypothetical protein
MIRPDGWGGCPDQGIRFVFSLGRPYWVNITQDPTLENNMKTSLVFLTIASRKKIM